MTRRPELERPAFRQERRAAPTHYEEENRCAPTRHAKARAAERAPARPRLLGRHVEDAIRTGLVLHYDTDSPSIAMVIATDGRRWIVDLHTRRVLTTLPTWRLR